MPTSSDRSRTRAWSPLVCLVVCTASSLAAACQGTETTPPIGGDQPAVNTAFYLGMRDGVRIAVDLWLPGGASASHPVPTLIRATRYSRDQEVLDRSAKPETDTEVEARAFVRSGYAEVIVDARGSAASFGTRAQPWSPDEVADYGEIVDWIVAQPWSSGRVGAFGTSYDGNTAELIGSLGKSAVKAVVPRFGYPDLYTDLIFPGGLFNDQFVKSWLARNKAFDTSDVCLFAGVTGPECDGYNAVLALAKPVDADRDHALRTAAIAQHAGSPEQYGPVSVIVDIGDLWNGVDLPSLSPSAHRARAESTGTAVMAWASWMDLGTARGALDRWKASDVPMVVYLGPWNHGADLDSSPLSATEAPLVPSAEEQRSLTIAFLDQYLKGRAPAPLRKIVYYSIGDDVRKETTTWPPAGTVTLPLFLRAGHTLSPVLPTQPEAPDGYQVDFSATTGPTNGWWTKFSAGDVVQGDRRAEDDKLLVYTMAALTADTEITGHPQVTLHLSSSETDGAVFVYLEDVGPDGTVTYLTEGQLRLRHRKVQPCGRRDPYGPCHSYRAEDARPMTPGVLEEVTIGLGPVSVVMRAGHAIRIAIAGHDASTFARLPGNPLLSLAHDPAHPSRVELPIAPRR